MPWAQHYGARSVIDESGHFERNGKLRSGPMRRPRVPLLLVPSSLSEDRLENPPDNEQANDKNHENDSANYFEHKRAPPGTNVWTPQMFFLAGSGLTTRRDANVCSGSKATLGASWRQATMK